MTSRIRSVALAAGALLLSGGVALWSPTSAHALTAQTHTAQTHTAPDQPAASWPKHRWGCHKCH
ncbi:hypothetical protein AB0L06_26310 [Spirillospora sp. NPDC052269]